MSDEGLHEIQLNGKQLVFLFMTATVVAVVIFLCGVMVGRGVPAQRGTPVLATDGTDPTTSDEARTTASATDAAATPTAASSPAASPSSKLGLTYPNRLEEPEPVAEDVPAGLPAHEAFATTAVAKVPAPAAPAKAGAKPAPSKAAATVAATTAVSNTKDAKDTADAAPAGAGFVVQVAAVRQRSEADAIRGRLARKGYPAFVATAGTSGAPTYRVRVGKYPSRREADTVAAKLEREEQFKPWVTR
jgi:cell division septation protein DedD